MFNLAFDYETTCINTLCTLQQNVGGLFVPAIVTPAPSDRAKAAVSFGRPKQSSAALYGSVQRQSVELCKKKIGNIAQDHIIYVHIRNATKKLWLCLFFIIFSMSLMICGPVLTRLLFQTELEFAILETVGAHRLQSSRCIEGMYIIGYIPPKKCV